MVEKLRRAETGNLLYDVTVEDPNVFAAPWIMPQRTFPLRQELEKIDEFVCENNRDYRPLFKKVRDAKSDRIHRLRLRNHSVRRADEAWPRSHGLRLCAMSLSGCWY